MCVHTIPAVCSYRNHSAVRKKPHFAGSRSETLISLERLPAQTHLIDNKSKKMVSTRSKGKRKMDNYCCSDSALQSKNGDGGLKENGGAKKNRKKEPPCSGSSDGEWSRGAQFIGLEEGWNEIKVKVCLVSACDRIPAMASRVENGLCVRYNWRIFSPFTLLLFGVDRQLISSK